MLAVLTSWYNTANPKGSQVAAESYKCDWNLSQASGVGTGNRKARGHRPLPRGLWLLSPVAPAPWRPPRPWSCGAFWLLQGHLHIGSDGPRECFQVASRTSGKWPPLGQTLTPVQRVGTGTFALLTQVWSRLWEGSVGSAVELSRCCFLEKMYWGEIHRTSNEPFQWTIQWRFVHSQSYVTTASI